MTAVNQHSNHPGTSLAYITIGGFLAVFAGTSYFFFSFAEHPVLAFLRAAALIGGIGMIVLGLSVGYIGRAARKADVVPQAAAAEAPKAASPVAAGTTNGQPASAPLIAAAAKPPQ